ncbi:MAG: DUF6985 domain-containing protein [Bacillota bacterium]
MKDKLESYKIEQIEKTIRRRNKVALAMLIPLNVGIAFVAFAFAVNGDTVPCIAFLLFMLPILLLTGIMFKAIPEPLKYRNFFYVHQVDGASNKQLWADIRDREGYKYDKEYGFKSSLFFKRKVSVSASNVSKEYVYRCIECFQNLNEDEVGKLIGWAWDDVAMCREQYDFDQAGVAMDNEASGSDILAYIYPEVMFIPDEEIYEGQEDPEKILFTVICDAEWELPEYQVYISVEDGRITQIESY